VKVEEKTDSHIHIQYIFGETNTCSKWNKPKHTRSHFFLNMCGCGIQQHFSTKDRKNDSGNVESTIVQSLINLCTKWLITTHQKVDFTISDFQCKNHWFHENPMFDMKFLLIGNAWKLFFFHKFLIFYCFFTFTIYCSRFYFQCYGSTDKPKYSKNPIFKHFFFIVNRTKNQVWRINGI
jgi:hypothetical protein